MILPGVKENLSKEDSYKLIILCLNYLFSKTGNGSTIPEIWEYLSKKKVNTNHRDISDILQGLIIKGVVIQANTGKKRFKKYRLKK